MQKIVPFLWFDGNAEEGAALYTEVFEGAEAVVTSRYPTEGLPDFQRGLEGRPVVVDVVIDGFRIGLINAGNNYRPGIASSFLVNMDPLFFNGDADAAITRLDAMWALLADGGEVRMPLGAYPFSARYGWVEDRYGVNWQLMLTDPAGEPRPFIIPSLMFSGAAQNRASEAMEFYTELFNDSRQGFISPYPAPTGPAPEGAVQFAEFQLEGQRFTAMDSGVPVDETFTPGVSWSVSCADQAEIDRLWDALSAVPEAEQCGWLVDKFGFSWQIVPANTDELLQRPGAFEHMMEMKKLIIADF